MSQVMRHALAHPIGGVCATSPAPSLCVTTWTAGGMRSHECDEDEEEVTVRTLRGGRARYRRSGYDHLRYGSGHDSVRERFYPVAWYVDLPAVMRRWGEGGDSHDLGGEGKCLSFPVPSPFTVSCQSMGLERLSRYLSLSFLPLPLFVGDQISKRQTNLLRSARVPRGI